LIYAGSKQKYVSINLYISRFYGNDEKVLHGPA